MSTTIQYGIDALNWDAVNAAFVSTSGFRGTLTADTLEGPAPMPRLYLGPRGTELALPYTDDFSEDVVRMGINHRILNGMVIEDRFGVRHEFFIRWDNMTHAELNQLRTLLYARGSLSFKTLHPSRHVAAVASFAATFDPIAYAITDHDYSTTVATSSSLFLRMAEFETIGGVSFFLKYGSAATNWTISVGTPPATWTTVYTGTAALAPGLHTIEFPAEHNTQYVRLASFGAVEWAEAHPLSRRFDVVQSNSQPIKYKRNGPYYEATLGLEQAVR